MVGYMSNVWIGIEGCRRLDRFKTRGWIGDRESDIVTVILGVVLLLLLLQLRLLLLLLQLKLLLLLLHMVLLLLM